MTATAWDWGQNMLQWPVGTLVDYHEWRATFHSSRRPTVPLVVYFATLTKLMNMKGMGSAGLKIILRRFGALCGAVVLVLGITGCKTTSSEMDQQAALAAAAQQAVADSRQTSATSTNTVDGAVSSPQATGDKLLLREGDTVRITFPGAANLNAVQAIRRDGKITLPLVGEVQAAGIAPTDLEKRLIELYGPELQTKEVSVALESSAFTLYVVGAVVRPGKLVSPNPLNALEAIMEAGGFDMVRANMKRVRVIRYVQGKPEYHTLNMKGILSGPGMSAFMLRPSDIVYVPERFTWF